MTKVLTDSTIAEERGLRVGFDLTDCESELAVWPFSENLLISQVGGGIPRRALQALRELVST